MALQGDLLIDLEPQVHNIIKKQLGFSEPTLLSASINCLQHGGNREELTRKFILQNLKFLMIFFIHFQVAFAQFWIIRKPVDYQIKYVTP